MFSSVISEKEEGRDNVTALNYDTRVAEFY
jgi:hypothetical protein